mmetsp:Transcript_57006/g.123389  ORF Transcript_57006/g.123389 Transcript_57006/m.123389 type:complete len:311 (-) Transcript_57006:116-1048(-)
MEYDGFCSMRYHGEPTAVLPGRPQDDLAEPFRRADGQGGVRSMRKLVVQLPGSDEVHGMSLHTRTEDLLAHLHGTLRYGLIADCTEHHAILLQELPEEGVHGKHRFKDLFVELPQCVPWHGLQGYYLALQEARLQYQSAPFHIAEDSYAEVDRQSPLCDETPTQVLLSTPCNGDLTQAIHCGCDGTDECREGHKTEEDGTHCVEPFKGIGRNYLHGGRCELGNAPMEGSHVPISNTTSLFEVVVCPLLVIGIEGPYPIPTARHPMVDHCQPQHESRDDHDGTHVFRSPGVRYLPTSEGEPPENFEDAEEV